MSTFLPATHRRTVSQPEEAGIARDGFIEPALFELNRESGDLYE
jgi:hypothetical protein